VSRATLNLTPAGEAVGTTLVLAAMLLAEAAIDRWASTPTPTPAVDAEECFSVCAWSGGVVERYGTTECVCKHEGS
jgi:hypothetical protein